MDKKSKLNHIQSKIETLIMHYDDPALQEELETILEMIKYEQGLRVEVLNNLSSIIAKL